MRQTRASEAPQKPGRSARNRPAGRPRPARQARVHLHPRRCGRAARRIRKLAVHHRHPRPARPAGRDRPDRHPTPAITGSPPPATIPGSSSGTCHRSGTPSAPDPCAGVPRSGRISSTTPRTTKAAGAACATADRSAGTSTGSSKTPAGRSNSPPRARSGGRPPPAGSTPRNQPATRYESKVGARSRTSAACWTPPTWRKTASRRRRRARARCAPPGTWWAPALPMTCRAASANRSRPEAPIGLELSTPPDGLTGSRPPMAVSPASVSPNQPVLGWRRGHSRT